MGRTILTVSPGVRKFTYKKKPKKVKQTNQTNLLDAIDNVLTEEDLRIQRMPFIEWVEKGPSIFDWSDRLREHEGIIFK